MNVGGVASSLAVAQVVYPQPQLVLSPSPAGFSPFSSLDGRGVKCAVTPHELLIKGDETLCLQIEIVRVVQLSPSSKFVQRSAVRPFLSVFFQ